MNHNPSHTTEACHSKSYSTIWHHDGDTGIILQHVREILHVPHEQDIISRSFVALGGGSIDAVVLSQRCRCSGISLNVSDVLQSASLADMVRVSVSASKSGPPLGPHCCHLGTALRKPPYPMTEMQKTLVQGSFSRPGTNIIHHRQTCALAEVVGLKHAWQIVLGGEEIFRSDFRVEDDKYQIVERGTMEFHWEEINAESAEEYDAAVDEWPMFSEVLSQFKAVHQRYNGTQGTSCIIWSVHHALIDGYSMQILLDKVQKVLRQEPITPGPSFSCLAEALLRMQNDRKGEAQRFWQRQQERASGVSDTLLLPSPSQPTSNVRCSHKSIMPSVTSATVREHAGHLKVTPATIYLAAWAMVLSHLCDADSVVFGLVYCGRDLDLPGIIEVVGPVINTLPLYVAVDRRDSAAKFIRNVFSEIMELSKYQWTAPNHGFSRGFTSAVAMQFETSIGAPACYPSMTMINSGIPLSIMIGINGQINFHYLENHLTPAHINRLATQYANALAIFCRSSCTMDECFQMIIPSDLRQQLLDFGNCDSKSTTEVSVQHDLVSLFHRTASKYPFSIAAEHGDKYLSYSELSHKSDRLAQYLATELQVKQGEIICVHADQSINWIVAIYGILKAGGVYCPINPNLTPDLRSSMITSAGSRILLVPNTSGEIALPENCRCIVVAEAITSAIQRYLPEENDAKRTAPRPSAGAYLCFTSGSTGKPKGVLCSHRGLVAFQKDLRVRLFANPGVKVAQIMSVSFDGSIHEIFSSLSYGATLVLPDSSDPFRHLQEVDSAILTPSVAKVLQPAKFPNLRNVYLVGEPVPQDVTDSWASLKHVYNMYGPTEATCGATIKKLEPRKPVTVGHCSPSTRIYILNNRRELLLPGLIGQIYIAGVQVAYGYLGHPDTTTKQFLEDSIMEDLNERMYATGDYGYWDEKGELILLGRHDRQIKLRGFRLDLDGLETRILRIPGVTAAAVMRKEDSLIAMLQPSNLQIKEIKAQMSIHLPQHALPRVILATDKFPKTAIGKRDYQRMLAMVDEEAISPPQTDTMTPCEFQIARMWREILGLPGTTCITPESSLLELGGHSIHQLRLADALSTVFNSKYSVQTVINAETLRHLAHIVEQDSQQTRSTDILSARKGIVVDRSHQLSSIEAEWVAKYEMECGTSAFNVSLAYELENDGIRTRLIEAWDQVLSRHRILSSRFIKRRAGYYHRQYFARPPQTCCVESLDLWEQVNRPFHLQTEYPIRVMCSQDILLIVASHIICDLTAMQLLLNEVAAICDTDGGTLGTPLPPDHSYMRSPAWRRTVSEDDYLFWSTYLDALPAPGFPRLPRFTFDRTAYSGTSSIVTLPSDTCRRMKACTQSMNITFHQFCLGAVTLALHPNLDDFDVLLGAPFLNRTSAVDMETVGLFLEPLAIRIQSPSSNPSALSFLQAIQKSSRAALSHAAPWRDLWPFFSGDTEFPNHPLFDVMVTFHHQQEAAVLPVQGVKPLCTWAQGSKFKLMFEFTHLADTDVLLRVEYDDSLVSTAEVGQLQKLVQAAIDLLARNVDWGHIKSGLKAALEMQSETMRAPDATISFGARMRNPVSA